MLNDNSIAQETTQLAGQELASLRRKVAELTIENRTLKAENKRLQDWINAKASDPTQTTHEQRAKLLGRDTDINLVSDEEWIERR